MRHEDESTATVPGTDYASEQPRKARKPRKDKGIKRGAKPRKAAARSKAGEIPMAALIKARKDYVVDKKNKTPGGNASVHCGDPVAKKLLGMTLAEVYELAAKAKDLTPETLRRRYSHMNPGAQRMVLGNILRAAA